MGNDEDKEERKDVALLWLFVPVFLGALGGWLAWRRHKEKERELARIMLIVGIVFTVIIFLLYVWLISGQWVALVHL